MPRKTPLPEPTVEGVNPALRDEFERLDARIEQTLELIARLKKENLELQRKLAALQHIQDQVARRLDAVLDKIDELT